MKMQAFMRLLKSAVNEHAVCESGDEPYWYAVGDYCDVAEVAR